MSLSIRPLTKSALAIAVAAASGLSVLSARADAAAPAFARHQMAVTLDHVALQVSSPDVPVGKPYVAEPGNSVQVASVASTKPYGYLSVMAVPFGETLPQSIYPFPESKAGDVAAWSRALHGTANGPVATIFGQKVRGTIVRSHGNLTGKRGSRTDIQAIQWIVDQGGRTWVVNLQHDQSGLSGGFGRNLTVSSSDSSAHSSVDLKRLSAATPAPITRTPMVQPNDVPLSGSLGRPSWWSSTCDGNGSPLSSSGSFMGLQVCGGGSEKIDSVPGVSQYEWQCADLSDRYLVQRYGLNGPGGNGNQEAANWYNAHPSKFQLHSSGDGTAPLPGDVISFAVGSSAAGHTGVVYKSTVDSSGNGTVYFVDQNWTGDGGYNSTSVSNWHVDEITGEGGTVQWLHDPNDTSAPPVPHGTVWDRQRNADGTWASSAGEIDSNDGITDVSAAGLPNGTMHVDTVVNGTVWDRQRNTDGTWTGSGEIDSNGNITAVATTALPDGSMHVYTLVNGSVWDRARYANGTWQSSAREIDANGSITALSAATLPDGTTHVDTVANGTVWDRQINKDGTVNGSGEIDTNDHITAVTTTALPDGSMHVYTVVNGSVWDRARYANGTWQGGAQEIDANGSITALSAAALPDGTTHVDTVANGTVWDRQINEDGSRNAAGEIDSNGSVFGVYTAVLPNGTMHVGTNA
jgi:hypothetical protein